MDVVKYPKFYIHNLMFFIVAVMLIWKFNLDSGYYVAIDTIIFPLVIILILLPLSLLLLPLTLKGRNHQIYFQRSFAISLFLSFIAILAIIIPASLLGIACGITVPCEHLLMPFLTNQWYSLGILFLGSIMNHFWLPMLIAQWFYLAMNEELILKIKHHLSLIFVFILTLAVSDLLLSLLGKHIFD